MVRASVVHTLSQRTRRMGHSAECVCETTDRARFFRPPRSEPSRLTIVWKRSTHACSACSKAVTRHPFIRTAVFIRAASLVLLLSSVTAYIRGQTSIVVFKNSTQVIAGTDSKARLLDGSSSKMCKIYREGALFWAVSGKAVEIRPVVIDSHRNTTTIRRAVENFCSIAPPKWKFALEQLRAANPKDFEHFTQTDGGIEQFIFFGMDKKTPVVAYVGIAATEDSSHRLTIQVNKDIRDTPCESDECGFTIGDDKAIREI